MDITGITKSYHAGIQKTGKSEILYAVPVEPYGGRAGVFGEMEWGRREIENLIKFQIYTIDSNSPVIIRGQEVRYE
jgi:hypothetical protein